MNRNEKYDQANKEAKAVGIGLILIIVFWIACRIWGQLSEY